MKPIAGILATMMLCCITTVQAGDLDLVEPLSLYLQKTELHMGSSAVRTTGKQLMLPPAFRCSEPLPLV